MKKILFVLPTVVSMAMVLMLSGLIGILALLSRQWVTTIQQDQKVSILLRQDVDSTQTMQIKDSLAKLPNVLTVDYVTKEQGLEQMKAQYGDNLIEPLRYNPFPDGFEVGLKEGEFDKDKLKAFADQLYSQVWVRFVDYEANQIEKILSYSSTLFLIMGGLLTVVLTISIFLIYNTIRLTIYSNRFIIRSMQLVGATGWMIRRPIMFTGMMYSVYASFLAAVILWSLPSFISFLSPSTYDTFGYLIADIGWELPILFFFGLLLLGMSICLLSTYFAVNKYLKMKIDDLF